ncbi:MAG TPA: DNA polymerase III subunit alpha [Candidatus Faecicola pullistercoris]|nr:DNA polymerase III subunit alpha [Candidatus Faecicola pullistercoris]
MSNFVHLHLHTEYSLLDGFSRIKKGKSSPLKQALTDRGMTACAITDHGNMYGVYPFVESLKDSGIKPIIGSEFYVVDNYKIFRPDEVRNHLILIAKNQKGYENLMFLSSESFINGFYYKPRVDLDLIAAHSEGLICLSGCIQGKIPELLLNGDYDGAKRYALKLKSMFGEGDFYLEVQYHGTSKESLSGELREMSIGEKQNIVNPLLRKISDETGIKLVATNDVHYIDKEDADCQDVMMCINMQRKVNDPTRLKMEPQEYYLKTYDEMLKMLPAYKDALDNTVEIARKCNVEVLIEAPEGHYEIPAYVPEDEQGKPLNVSNEEYLKDMTYKGLLKKYGRITPGIRERAEKELQVITKMGFAGYYLIVWDFINYAKKHNIPVGPGRGSGVGSIVAYAIGITNVDPLKYDLLFERFLNEERISMPDFDIDFCIEGRGDVINYVTRKYHPENVTQIIAFGTLSARAAVKDVARAYDVPYAEADKWAKAIPVEQGKSSIEKALGRVTEKDGKAVGASPDFISFYETDAMAKSVIDMAIKLEGLPRQTSMHAAGVLICPKPVVSYLPMQKKDESVTTQFDKDQVEHMGLVKMDFLGLRTLTDIDLALRYVKEDYGKDIDFDKLGVDDPEVYKEISSGDTVAIFQLESGGMCSFMSRLKPTKLEEVIAGVSLYRPGPMQFIDKYISGKNNPDKVVYDHDKLKSILGVTYGCIVYQEQVMQIARELAGYSLGGADLLRRAMGKKKHDVMVKNKEIFIHGKLTADKDGKPVDGAVKRGIPEDVASKLFDKILDFASYAFNKSHAAAYSVVTYQTAYLKRYYPAQFMTAVLNNRITDAKEISKYVNYLNSVNIKVLPPDINKSSLKFKTEGKCVRFGLMAIKNVGEQVVNAIISEREKNGPYTDLENLLRRNDEINLNKRMVENMIKGGAFDCFGRTRSSLIASYEQLMDIVSHDKKNSATGQISLFDDFAESEPAALSSFKYPDYREYDDVDKLIFEKQVLGMYATGHPLNSYKETLKRYSFNTSKLYSGEDAEESDIDEERPIYDVGLNDSRVVMGGVLSSFEKKLSKKNGKYVGSGVLEDLYGSVSILVFADALEKYKSLLKENSFVAVSGRLRISDNEATIMVSSVQELEKCETKKQDGVKTEKSAVVYLKTDKQNDIAAIQSVLKLHKGQMPVRVQTGGKLLEFSEKVSVSDDLVMDLADIVGEAFVKVVYTD